jgi:hypothetical protein
MTLTYFPKSDFGREESDTWSIRNSTNEVAIFRVKRCKT